MFQLLAPYFALGLLGILLPLALHWWNKQQQKPILIGSTRFLEESAERRLKNLQFKDFWLFLLRAGLLALFTFLLMEPVFLTKEAPKSKQLSKWVIIEPKIYESGHLQTTLDSLCEVGYGIRLLENNFPNIGSDGEETSEGKEKSEIKMPLFSLLKEVEKRQNRPDTVLLFAYPTKENLKGEKPALDFTLQWPNLPGEDSRVFLAQATKRKEQLRISFGRTDEEGVQFFERRQEYKSGAQLGFEGFPTVFFQEGDTLIAYLEGEEEQKVIVGEEKNIQVQIIHSSKYNQERKIILAALAAIKTYKNTSIEITQIPASSTLDLAKGTADLVVWLSDQKMPSTKEIAPVWLRIGEGDYQELPIVETGQNIYTLSPDLDPKEGDLRTSRLPVALLGLLYDKGLKGPDERRFPQGEFAKREKVATSAKEETVLTAQTALHFFVWVLLVALFVVERFAAQTISSAKKEKL